MMRLVMVAVCMVQGLVAQELLWRREGVGGQLWRGNQLARLGDVNGDGWEDLIEHVVVDQPVVRAAIAVSSSANGTILSLSAPLPVWSYVLLFQSLSPLGDMNQDGVPDYAVTVYDAAPPTPVQWVEVRSGLTHATLWTVTIPNAWSHWYGGSIAGDMDLDGDGRRDLVVSASNMSPLGTLFVYDHAGNERYRLVDPLTGILVGTDVAPLHGDLDGDGCEDFLAAGPDFVGRGAVVVFSGKKGDVLRVSYGVQPNDKLTFATACGDLDGDGVPDYAGGGSFFGPSVVTAFSGATGQAIHTWRYLAHPYMGINLIGGFDLDQDGVNDIVAGQDQYAVHALSGRDGTFLWSHIRPNRGIGIGQAILAPPPGEQYPLVVYSEREWSHPQLNPVGQNNIMPGLLWAFRGNPDGVRAYGAPDTSVGLAPARSGMRDLPGQAVRWTLSGAPPGQLALLLVGNSDTIAGGTPLPASLDVFGMPGVTMLTSADGIVNMTTGITGIASGYAEADLLLPPGQALSLTGTSLYSQWVWLDPADLSQGGSTAGQRFRVQ